MKPDVLVELKALRLHGMAGAWTDLVEQGGGEGEADVIHPDGEGFVGAVCKDGYFHFFGQDLHQRQAGVKYRATGIGHIV